MSAFTATPCRQSRPAPTAPCTSQAPQAPTPARWIAVSIAGRSAEPCDGFPNSHPISLMNCHIHRTGRSGGRDGLPHSSHRPGWRARWIATFIAPAGLAGAMDCHIHRTGCTQKLAATTASGCHPSTLMTGRPLAPARRWCSPGWGEEVAGASGTGWRQADAGGAGLCRRSVADWFCRWRSRRSSQVTRPPT